MNKDITQAQAAAAQRTIVARYRNEVSYYINTHIPREYRAACQPAAPETARELAETRAACDALAVALRRIAEGYADAFEVHEIEAYLRGIAQSALAQWGEAKK